MADPAGTKSVEEPQKTYKQTPEGTRKRLKRERNPVWCHIIKENVGRDPPYSRCNPAVDLCKNSGNFLKMPEELLVVTFIAINVFSRFVMKLDLADPNFSDFRSNSANTMHFCLTPILDLVSI